MCNGNCGIFVLGNDCALSGLDLVESYEELRAAGCQKCGSQDFGDGCGVTIDYVTKC